MMATAAAGPGLRDRRLAPLMLGLLFSIVVSALARPLVDVPWHPPDPHGSLPHRAVAPGLGTDPGSGGTSILPAAIGQRQRLASGPLRKLDRPAAEPPELPPR